MATRTPLANLGRTTDPLPHMPETGAVITPRIEVSVLGGFEVRVNGQPVASRHWSRRHSAALVKLLATSGPGQPRAPPPDENEFGRDASPVTCGGLRPQCCEASR